MKSLIAILSLTLSGTALADQALAQKNMCLACHAVDTKLVGPSYKDVAAKYRDQKDSVSYLVNKIKNGGSGVWGVIPMPAQPQLSDKDAETLAKWILQQ